MSNPLRSTHSGRFVSAKGAGTNPPRRDNRRKFSVALDDREIADLEYVLERLGYAKNQLAPLEPIPSGEEPADVSGDMNVAERFAALQRIQDYALRAELKRTFGTTDLPTDQTDVIRLAVRLLARTLQDATMAAESVALAADPVEREEAADDVGTPLVDHNEDHAAQFEVLDRADR